MITPYPTGHAHIKIFADDNVSSFRCENCQKFKYGEKKDVTDEAIADWVAKHTDCQRSRGYVFPK